MSNPALTIYVTEPSLLARIGWLFRRAGVAAFEDNCFGVAKGAAYSCLLSLFPVLTAITALLVQANAVAVARVISRVVFEVAPPGTQALLENFLIVQGKRPGGLLVTAILLSIWAASGAMMSLMEGFRAAYRIPTGRQFLKERAIAAALVICAAAPLVGGSALIVFGSRTEGVIVKWLGFSPEGEQLAGSVVLLSLVIRYTLAFGSIVLAAALLYRIAPNRKIRFKDVWPGAFIATALWGGATLGFAWYVQNIANYNVLYKSIGAVIALLVWMYMLAVVALFGCEFNVAVDYLHRVRAHARLVKPSEPVTAAAGQNFEG